MSVSFWITLALLMMFVLPALLCLAESARGGIRYEYEKWRYKRTVRKAVKQFMRERQNIDLYGVRRVDRVDDAGQQFVDYRPLPKFSYGGRRDGHQ